MKLFEVDENREVQLNKAWIQMIPEFQELFKRDKGSKGDYRGERKLRTTRELTYIYFIEDFSSPLRDWEPDEKKRESLYYANLTEKDIDDKVLAAQAKYAEMMLKSSRSLRTLKSVYKGMEAMDKYFEDLDFTKTDKQGKLLNDPSAFGTNITKLNKVYDELRNFEKRVEDDLKQSVSGIRGPNSTLGDNEGKKKTWSESDISQGSAHTAGTGTETPAKAGGTSFNDILKTIQAQAKKEKAIELVQSQNLKDIFEKDESDNDEEDLL
jgi:hypothetical protein